MKRKTQKKHGLTLIELLMAVGMFVLILGGIWTSFIVCLKITRNAQNSLQLLAAAQNRMEQIKAASFTTVINDFNGKPFVIEGVKAKGVTYLNATTVPHLLDVVICVSWRQNQTVIGEDQNLNGELDQGEDQNHNGRLDSPFQLVAKLYDPSSVLRDFNPIEPNP